ncbi:MAG: amidohydrolase [Cyclobacteriaceae bacterium]|nr:amidohydrolase [Cyclobacteriaceae bacterium]
MRTDSLIKSLFFFSFIFLFACTPKREVADMVVLGGKIYTVNAEQPVVEAVVVLGDKIKFAGSVDEARIWIGEKTQVIDLQGKIMTPGFIEGHGHIMGVGYSELNLDLMNVANYAEITERVKEAASKAQAGQWIVGRGWHQDKWDTKPGKIVKGFPTHQQLSEASPNNPVFLEHASGHLAIVNAKAMEIAGIQQISRETLKNYADDSGEVIRDEMGNPTGIFNENAMTIITQHIPENNSDTDAQALELAIQACWRNGITSFQDAGASRENIELFTKFKSEGKLGVRLYVMLTGYDRDLIYEWMNRGPEIDSQNLLTIRSIKLNCDGALGSRGAWLLEPYSDRPDFSGMATLSMDTVLKTSHVALKQGFQVCSHAIGDRANREILNRYEMAFRENPDQAKDHRFRIEHAQHIHPDDLPRFSKLGVLPAMQAIHMASDRPWAIDRLGAKRIKEGAYMWQSLLKSGSPIINGTDAPVEPLNPIPCFYASVARKTLKGEPEGGYEPEEKMTREQALQSYTLDAAFGAFEEAIKGSIQPGKLADFTIFTQDVMSIPEEQILKTEVSMTIVGGKVVFTK